MKCEPTPPKVNFSLFSRYLGQVNSAQQCDCTRVLRFTLSESLLFTKGKPTWHDLKYGENVRDKYLWKSCFLTVSDQFGKLQGPEKHCKLLVMV